MINLTLKRPQDQHKADLNYYLKSFNVALLNWELNRKEELLGGNKVKRHRK